MNYSVEISEHNLQPHLDIEKEVQAKKNGLFTFTLRVNNSQIVDCNVMEYADASDYLSLKSIVIEEYVIKK